MKIYEDLNLSGFEFWGGASATVEQLTEEDLEILENALTEEYPDGIGKTELNDLFWFEEDTIAAWLGYSSFSELEEERAIPLF